jgi:lipoyl(octanoyl) transferase
MHSIDLGLIAYRDAWALQERAVEAVKAGEEERAYLLEHLPVITCGRRPSPDRNLLAPAAQLQQLGVELVASDRGGDITYHGPGQLVVYPIVRLADHHLMVGSYVRRLLETVIACLADFDIPAQLDPAAIGVWVRDGDNLAKICALGVRIRHGVSMHGIALNVTTDLSFFDLINPCGLGRPVTSMQRLLGPNTPAMAAVKTAMIRHLAAAFGQAP